MLSELFTSPNPVALAGSRVKVLFGAGSLIGWGSCAKRWAGGEFYLLLIRA